MARRMIYLIYDVEGGESTATSMSEAGAQELESVGFRRVDRETYRRFVAHCIRLDQKASKPQIRD